jgi:hypothetical protein
VLGAKENCLSATSGRLRNEDATMDEARMTDDSTVCKDESKLWAVEAAKLTTDGMSLLTVLAASSRVLLTT